MIKAAPPVHIATTAKQNLATLILKTNAGRSRISAYLLQRLLRYQRLLEPRVQLGLTATTTNVRLKLGPMVTAVLLLGR